MNVCVGTSLFSSGGPSSYGRGHLGGAMSCAKSRGQKMCLYCVPSAWLVRKSLAQTVRLHLEHEPCRVCVQSDRDSVKKTPWKISVVMAPQMEHTLRDPLHSPCFASSPSRCRSAISAPNLGEGIPFFYFGAGISTEKLRTGAL